MSQTSPSALDTPPPPASQPTPQPVWHRAWTVARRDRASILGWLAGAICLVAVLAAHGFVPGSSQVPLTALHGTGAIQCLHDQGLDSLRYWCMSLGLPVGAPQLTGWPVIYLGWGLTLLGLDSWSAHQIVNAAFVAAGFAGGYGLLRRWRAPVWVALALTTSYQVSINLAALNGFAYTFLGYILVPAYVWAALWVLDSFDRKRWVRGVVVALVLCLLMVFTDGYSFFGAGVVIACLVLAWAWRRVRAGTARRASAGLAVWAGAVGCAAATYVAWAPAGSYQTVSDLETFAYYGVDLTTLLVPRYTVLPMALFDVDVPMPELWGVSASIDVNYLGAGFALLAIVPLIHWLRRRVRVHFSVEDGPVAAEPQLEEPRGPRTPAASAEVGAMGAAGLVALLLAMGPVLKLGQTMPGMENALFMLPTVWAYENVPGLAEMRATHRWLVVTRLCVLLVAGTGLSQLWRWAGNARRRQFAVLLAGLIAVVDTAPDLGAVADYRRDSLERVQTIRDGVTAEASRMLEPGAVVLLMPAGNDFLANYLVPMAGVRSFNIGVDKNYELSRAHWPENVQLAGNNYGPEAATGMCMALSTDVDAVVLPNVSPFSAVLLAPADRQADAERVALAREFAADRRFDAEIGEFMTVLRGADPACLPPVDP